MDARGGRRRRVKRVEAPAGLAPDACLALAQAATVLYDTPFRMAARVSNEPNLALTDEERTAVSSAFNAAIIVYQHQLGDKLPLILFGVALSAPVIARADLIADVVKNRKARRVVLKPVKPAEGGA